jgi:hypothetical protein
MQLSAFYRECARQIPEEEEFWLTLAGAETEHAQALSSLFALAEAGGITVPEDAIHRDTLAVFTRYSSEQIRFITQNQPPMPMLLSIALDLEQTTLEQNPLTYFTGDAPELQETRTHLVTETRQHIGYILAKKAGLR